MSKLSVNELMVEIASLVNQEAVAPTAGSAEWNLWLSYLNRGVFEWSNASDWEVLRKRFYPVVTGTTQASVSMPADFRKIAAAPRIYDGSIETGVEFPELLPEQEGLFASTDKYFQTTGDLSSGFSLVFHPGTLASGASLVIQYFSIPTSLASNAQYPLVTDSQFLVDRTIAYIFESRADARFQTSEVKARERLMAMVENANMSKYSSFANQNRTMDDTKKSGFRIGRD
ncbi:hypothetical protein M0R04_15065 [Candidatus Dojkabacteria bacterium]|jgi:hypothetical protein|nr:hypothetical protein [Candidatus Dojkabacteria bacterium]